MAVFEYKALNAGGRQIKGVIDADSIRGARNKLKAQGIFPTEIQEGKEKQSGFSLSAGISLPQRGVSTSLLAVATRQLATLVAAGMPLIDSLKALSEQLDNQRLKRAVAEVTDLVNEGKSMAEAMKNYPKIFPRLYVNMVASGEASGGLDLVLERLADLLETQAALKRKVMAALTYPILMVVLCVGVIVLLLAYVVPEITKIFRDQGTELPLPTQIVIALSSFVQSYWWIIAVAAGLMIVLFKRYSVTPGGRLRVDQVKLKLPLVGGLALKIATSRFSRNLGTLLASGVELLTALSIVKNIVGNVVLENAIESAIVGVREGKSLAGELGRSAVFPKMLLHMIAVGEQSGQLEQMLLRAATSYESEVNAVITALTSILEPLLIIFLACIVGGILASVMLPMLEMNSLAA